MAYCTQQNMIDRFSEEELIQLTDRTNQGTIDSTVITQAINDASAEINGYLANYDLPLVVIPEILIRGCCDIARYFLHDDIAPEQIEKRYNRVIDYLRNVAKGSISLGVDISGDKPIANDSAVMKSGGRVFSRTDNGFL